MKIHTEHSVLINRDLDLVFDVTNQMEKWPELLPPCKDLRILDVENTDVGPKVTIEVTFHTGGRLMTWRSKRLVDLKTKSAQSERIAPLGPFKFMKMAWLYHQVDGGTKLTFIHDFKMKGWLLGYLIGRLYVVPVYISRDAKIELAAIKERLELSNIEASAYAETD